MRVIGLVVVGVMVLAGVFACGKTGSTRYTDPDMGISFEYPAAWKMTKKDGKLGLASTRAEKTAIMFSTFRNIPQDVPAGTAFDKVITRPYQSRLGFGDNLLPEASREMPEAQLKAVGAERGYKGKFEGVYDGRPSIFSVGLFIKGTDGYQVLAIVDADHFDKASATMVQVLNSFNITK